MNGAKPMSISSVSISEEVSLFTTSLVSFLTGAGVSRFSAVVGGTSFFVGVLGVVEEVAEGTHNIELNVANFASGTYFVTMTSDSVVLTRKMTVLK